MTDTPKQPLPSVDGEVVAWRWKTSEWDDGLWYYRTTRPVPSAKFGEIYTAEPLVLKSALDAANARADAAELAHSQEHKLRKHREIEMATMHKRISAQR